MQAKRKKVKKLLLIILGIAVLLTGVIIYLNIRRKPQELLTEYMNYISEGKYEKMYDMLDLEESGNITKEHFVERNSSIYEGIEIENIKVQIKDSKKGTVKYHVSFDSIGGNISFDSEARFVKRMTEYGLVWDDEMIFPELEPTDKVKVSTIHSQRGKILDRNDRILAEDGIASSVGIVPGKLKNERTAIKEIAELLDIKPEEIEKSLEAEWVQEDSLVPIKTIEKIEEISFMTLNPDEEVMKEKNRQDKLLEIPGVMFSDVEMRKYPLGEKAAHLVGYVQNVTAEDLKENAEEGYTERSVIGKSGVEALFEDELRGRDGYSISIVDAEGNEKTKLASTLVQNGKDIKLTIDSEIQKSLYEKFKKDKSCSVAMNQYTGEVLALVSTPSYDNNDFITGLSDEKWTALNEDKKKPLFNRFRQKWCPGSTFKPVIAAIGLQSGAIDPAKDYGNEGLKWQKDTTWGLYYVTTVHAYSSATMENALIYSDNIYFAKAALRIGSGTLENSLKKLGFDTKVPFEVAMSVSQYSNSEKIETEIQLADSGYGQGQILVNPLHLACIYTAFSNAGNIIKPTLIYEEEPKKEIWISGAFSESAAGQVLEGLKKVVSNPNGTGHAAYSKNHDLAGKTGTAEIKASQEDENGTELGWFSLFTTDPDAENPVLIISMVEDVKGNGGSGYVVQKDKEVMDEYLKE